MNIHQYTFKKAERLTHKKIIDHLFLLDKAHKKIIYPLLFAWDEIELTTSFPAQIVISVSRKFSKRAVDRNRAKRVIREVYRHNKHLLYEALETHNKQAAFLLMYIGREKPDYQSIHESFEKIIQHFSDTFK